LRNVDQPLRRQHLQRFAQRRARDAERLAQQALVELHAGREQPLDDKVAQVVDHGVMQALPFHLRQGRGQHALRHISILHAIPHYSGSPQF
jgi:hypothetical protein